MSSIDIQAEQRARLVAIRATEAELTDGADAALKVLGPPTDPIRMKATLAILLHAERFQQAADLVSDKVLDENWIDLGAFICAYSKKFGIARKMIDRADEFSDHSKRSSQSDRSDRSVSHRTRLGFAEGVVERWRKHCGDTSILAVTEWQPTDADLAVEVLEVLGPLLSLVHANNGIQGDLQLSAVQYAIYCSHIVRDRTRLVRDAKWLEKHIPVPLAFAELCLRRLLDTCPSELPSRLRVEHPGDFQAEYLAATVDRELPGHEKKAFDAFMQLASRATTDEEKEAVAVGLFATCPPEETSQALEVVKRLQPDNGLLVNLLNVFQLVSENNLGQARSQLNAIRDDSESIWWQVHAQLCEKEGDDDSAREAWEKAGELLPHPDIVRRSIQASLDLRRFESAERGLAKLLENDPNSKRDLEAMANTLVRLGEHAKATEYLRRLVDIDPAHAEYRMFLAQCLARIAKISDARDILKPIFESKDPPFEAFLLQSALLKEDNKPREAFQLLEEISLDYWEDPPFLLAYMNHAFAAGEDRLANEAFVRLVELRRIGKVPDKLMQECTLEDLLEYGKEFQRNRESLQEMVVGGRMPWLCAEEILRNTPMWAWTLHTQKLRWLSEERLSRAAFTIYSTNGFTVRAMHLTTIIAPPPGTEVDVDLSALVTLHQLGRLKEAAAFFGKLLLPDSYGGQKIHNVERFGLHQPSQETGLKKIRAKIDRSRISIAESDTPYLLLVDEYPTEKDQHAYRIQDMIVPLEAAQKTTKQAIQELRRVAHQPSSVDSDHPAIKLGAHLLIGLQTLRTLAGQSAFESALDSFTVHLSREQQDELSAELQAYERARNAKKDHDDLWNTVVGLEAQGKVSWMPPIPETEESADSVDEDGDYVPLFHFDDALKLAQHHGKPLLVDDRVLQVLMYQDKSSSNCSAFGTDKFLIAQLESDPESVKNVSADFHRLMQWRYRFLVPPPDLLLAWARESMGNLPGDTLLDIAVYLHDCLRDPGLHCGLEQSDPPMPIASRFVTTWIDSISSFLADEWNDKRFSDGDASVLTGWVGRELVPSCPRGLWYQPVGGNFARFEPNAMLQMAMVKFTGVEDGTRANRGLRILAESLGLDENAFLTAAVEANNAIK